MIHHHSRGGMSIWPMWMLGQIMNIKLQIHTRPRQKGQRYSLGTLNTKTKSWVNNRSSSNWNRHIFWMQNVMQSLLHSIHPQASGILLSSDCRGSDFDTEWNDIYNNNPGRTERNECICKLEKHSARFQLTSRWSQTPWRWKCKQHSVISTWRVWKCLSVGDIV